MVGATHTHQPCQQVYFKFGTCATMITQFIMPYFEILLNFIEEDIELANATIARHTGSDSRRSDLKLADGAFACLGVYNSLRGSACLRDQSVFDRRRSQDQSLDEDIERVTTWLRDQLELMRSDEWQHYPFPTKRWKGRYKKRAEIKLVGPLVVERVLNLEKKDTYIDSAFRAAQKAYMGASHFGMEYLDLSGDDEDEKEALPDTDSEASDSLSSAGSDSFADEDSDSSDTTLSSKMREEEESGLVEESSDDEPLSEMKQRAERKESSLLGSMVRSFEPGPSTEFSLPDEFMIE